ncbi:hypothetical protein IWQ51_006776 [Labrenzia sp. EL_142]|nr:hypothetical protein [Labrenzia sp. EL_142]
MAMIERALAEGAPFNRVAADSDFGVGAIETGLVNHKPLISSLEGPPSWSNLIGTGRSAAEIILFGQNRRFQVLFVTLL